MDATSCYCLFYSGSFYESLFAVHVILKVCRFKCREYIINTQRILWTIWSWEWLWRVLFYGMQRRYLADHYGRFGEAPPLDLCGRRISRGWKKVARIFGKGEVGQGRWDSCQATRCHIPDNSTLSSCVVYKNYDSFMLSFTSTVPFKQDANVN
jgi:hypothetical protein